MEIRRKDALDYHRQGRKGKIEVTPTKPCRTQWDLSLAYTPGVAEPCKEIQKDQDLSFEYTARGNLVAVVSNGTAVLGLGNIGAYASKPVMEGKAVLFKRFADIDVFDLEVGSENPDDVIKFCQLLEPTCGGINLEDIKAPECFYIEEELRKTLSIPAFHDDQHGTAIISGAALLNALELVEKKIDQVRVVFNGAGAAGLACALHYVRLGVRKENITMCDIHGVIYEGRAEGMNPYNSRFAVKTSKRKLAEVLEGADVFVGLSVGDCVTGEMLQTMAERPIIFALANPTPEISYPKGQGSAAGRYCGHGALRLSQPGEQRAGLPRHLPRRAGRAGACHQRGDEGGRHPRPGRPRQGGRARFRPARLRTGPLAVRARVHQSQTL